MPESRAPCRTAGRTEPARGLHSVAPAKAALRALPEALGAESPRRPPGAAVVAVPRLPAPLAPGERADATAITSASGSMDAN